MQKLLSVVCTAFVLAGASSATQAQVLYSFEAFSAFAPNVVGSFTHISSDFITVDTTVPAAALATCSVVEPAGDSCQSATFTADTTAFFDPPNGDNYDAVTFFVSSKGPIYYFQNGAFGAVGVYDTQIFGISQAGRLTVSMVPEPGTVAMFLAGVGLLGAVAQRRRA